MPARRRSASMTMHSAGHNAGGAVSSGLAAWLGLAAAPAFATMALLTATPGNGPADILCSAAHGSSPLGGMVPMYVLMSIVHAAPWLKLIGVRLSSYSLFQRG